MEINELLKILRDKYQYDDNTLSILQSVIPAMTAYFGKENENKIVSAFSNTPIVFAKDNDEIQQFASSIGIKGEYRMPTFASGGYEEYFQLNDNKQIERIPFVMIREKEMSEYYLNTIVHELCHMVMNYQKMQILDGKIVSKTGICKDEIEIVDGQVKITSSDINFEEGLNEYDAREITKLITGKQIESGNYDRFYNYVSCLMKNENARKVVDQSRLDGTDKWKDILGESLSDEYKDTLEEFSKVTLSFSIPKEERKQRSAELSEKMNRLMDVVDEKMNINSNLDEKESYVTLDQLEPLLSESGYMFYGHGTGRKGNSDEVVDSIFNEGLRTKNNSLYYTTIGLSAPTPELKAQLKEIGMPEPTMDDLKDKLNNWQHQDSKKIIIARIPTEYINKNGDRSDLDGEMFGAFYTQKLQPNGNKTNYLDTKYIVGCYDVDKQAVRLNKNFEKTLTPETIEKLKEGYNSVVEKTNARKRSQAMGITQEELDLAQQSQQNKEGVIDYNIDSYDSFDFPPIDWEDNSMGKSR